MSGYPTQTEGPISTVGQPLFHPDEVAEYRRAGWWTDRSVAEHVRDHALRQPDRPAFITADYRLTWAEYWVASGQLAEVLVGVGAERGSRVAVLLPDGPTVHVAYVAAERAGLVTVGIGARAGEQEVLHLLARSAAEVLVTFSSHRTLDLASMVRRARSGGMGLRHHVVVPPFEHDPTQPVLVDGQAAYADGSKLEARRPIRPDELALVNSTSGTTGLPKCVAHSQNRWHYVHRMALALARLDEGDVFYGAVPAPFGFGLWTAHFTPVYLGVPVVTTERFAVDDVLRLMERERVTVFCGVSTQFIMLLNAPEFDGYDLSSLRVMFTGGEAIPPERARSFEARTGATVLNFYGANESGIVTGTGVEDPLERRVRTAGRLLPGTRMRLFADGLDVTATGRGQPGSRGPAICLGYLDDPEATRQLMTSDGYVLHPDICTVDAEGFLTVVGRTSDIIIRGGKNISAIQVESEVDSHPTVVLSAAVAWPDEIFGERVAVYVELRDGATLGLDDLVDFLEARGASKEYLPEQLVVMDQLPRSSGGKVAKGELRADARRRAGLPGR